MDLTQSITTHSPEETRLLGKKIARSLPPNAVICFFGTLGAGKTTFIKGLAAEASGCDPEEVVSPTFTYLNIYEGKVPVYHFDLYRLRSAEEFLALGFDEYLDAGGISCIEWSERIASSLPSDCIRVEMTHGAGGSRIIKIISLNSMT